MEFSVINFVLATAKVLFLCYTGSGFFFLSAQDSCYKMQSQMPFASFFHEDVRYRIRMRITMALPSFFHSYYYFP